MDTNKNIQFCSFEKIRTIILGVFLSMGPMFWFPHIGKLHYMKAFVLFVLFLLYLKEILQKKEKLHFCFSQSLEPIVLKFAHFAKFFFYDWKKAGFQCKVYIGQIIHISSIEFS